MSWQQLALTSWISLLVILMPISTLKHQRRSYDGYQLWEVKMSKRQSSLLDSFVKDERVIMADTHRVGYKKAMLVPPDLVSLLKTAFILMDIKHKVIRENIQRYLDADWHILHSRVTDHQYDKNDWNSFNGIMKELDHLKERCPTNYECAVRIIGHTVEGRPIKVFQITKGGDNRKGILIDSLIHAREWLAGTTLMRIIDHMVTNADTDPEVQKMLDTYDWYFIPVLNPDGYEYTWTHDRYWRKNRNITHVKECMGIDLNRNFDAEWDSKLGRTQTDPCLATYRGEAPHSESETKALVDEVHRLADSLDIYVAIHTAANTWIWSWAFPDQNGKCLRIEDEKQRSIIERVGYATTKATADTYNTLWQGGTCCEILYAVAGAALDYVLLKEKIPLTYTVELRGQIFDPEPIHITPSFREIWNGFVAMVDELQIIRLEDSLGLI